MTFHQWLHWSAFYTLAFVHPQMRTKTIIEICTTGNSQLYTSACICLLFGSFTVVSWSVHISSAKAKVYPWLLNEAKYWPLLSETQVTQDFTVTKLAMMSLFAIHGNSKKCWWGLIYREVGREGEKFPPSPQAVYLPPPPSPQRD